MTMKSVGEIASQLSKTGARSTGRKAHNERPPEEKQRVQDLFIVLDQTYPFWLHGKSDEESGEIKRTWLHMLRRFDDRQVQKALKTCIKQIEDKGGPVLAQFLRMCETPTAHLGFDVQATLPAPSRVTESVGRKALSELKRKLNLK